MEKLTPDNIVVLFLGFGVMLLVARMFGEFFTRFKQPAIVGEILAGIVLGPTIFGALFPEWADYLFPDSGNVAIAYQTIINLGVVFLLMIAGLEIDLHVVWKQGRAAILVSLFSIIVPFSLGAGLAYLAPSFWGMAPGADPLIYALFLGIALSISALPVIAKIMLDLKLFKTDVGLLVMGAAMLNDLIGWLGFAIILGMLQAGSDTVTVSHAGGGIWGTIGMTLAVFALALTLGRWLIHRIMPYFQARLSWPGAVIAFTLTLTMFGASLTEAIGIHAVFGAFLAGIIVGDSPHLREKTRTILEQFVTYVFAPIFLVAMGLEADFVASFNLQLVLAILFIAFFGKLAGCMIGAYFGRLALRTSLAVSFGMNARGAMEIILALLAMQYGVIQSEVFVALVVLAVVSSLLSGPAMNFFITKPHEWKLDDLLVASTIVPDFEANSVEDAINKLAEPAAKQAGLDVELVRRALLRRESLQSTAIGDEIAIPRARFSNLTKPVLVVGNPRHNVHYETPDMRPVRLIFLLLVPSRSMLSQTQLISKIHELFRDQSIRDTVYETNSVDVIRALVKTESAPLQGNNDGGEDTATGKA